MDRARLDAAYADYCQQYHNNPVAMNVLQRFLDDRPVFQPPIDLLPVEEFEQRLDIVAQIEKRFSSCQPEFRVNAAAFSLFMIMPLTDLREKVLPAGSYHDREMAEALGNLPRLIRSFTMGPVKAVPGSSKTAPRKTRLSQTDSGDADSSDAAKLRKRPWIGGELDLATSSASHKRIHSEGSIVSRGSPVSDSSTQVRRSNSEKVKCEQRDGRRCIVTKTDCPEVCHVLPFSWSGSDRANIMAELFSGAMDEWLFTTGAKLDTKIRVAIITGELDKSWNMICLSASLHAWWGKCFFGLKYLGMTPSGETKKVTVKLEFRWLQQNQHTKAAHTLDQQQQHDFRDKLLQTPYPAVAANMCPSNRPMLSGQTVDVTLDDSDAPYFIGAIKLQWALVQLAAMSGGAEPTDEPLSRRDQMARFLSQLAKQKEPVNVAVAEWASEVPAGQAPPDETRARQGDDDEDTDPGDKTNPSPLREIPPKPANPLPRPSPRTSRPGNKSQNPPTVPPSTSTSPQRGPQQTKLQQGQGQQRSRQGTATNTKKENQPPRS